MRVTILWAVVSPLFSQQRPLVTERVETVPEGKRQVELGAEFFQDAVFALAGLKGDLSRVGVYGVRLGAGEKIEVQVLGTVQNVLNVEDRFAAPASTRLDFSGNSTSDFGDITVATKMGFTDQTSIWPALGMRFGAELPIASNESGLGVDETNAFTSLLLEKHFGGLELWGNIGLTLLGDPLDGGAQDDLLTYGLAFLCPLNTRFNLVGEWNGRAGPGGVGTEEQSLLRVGAQIKAAGFYWDAGVAAGLEETDPSWGLLVGLSKRF